MKMINSYWGNALPRRDLTLPFIPLKNFPDTPVESGQCLDLCTIIYDIPWRLPKMV